MLAVPAPAPPPLPQACVGTLGYGQLHSYLSVLSPGTRVALLSLVGSVCPPTLGHVLTLTAARDIMLGIEKPIIGPSDPIKFDACVALVSCNNDGYVRAKMADGGFIPKAHRSRLMQLAVARHNTPRPWIAVGNVV